MHFHHKNIAVLAANVLTIVFIFLLFSFQGNAEAQNAPDAPMVMGSVAGHVTDDTGLPLAGMNVTLYQRNSGFYKITQTDALGNYQVDSVVTGNYIVKFGREDSLYVTQYYKNADSEADAEQIAVVGNDVVGIDGSLMLGGKISGSVLLAPGVGPGYVVLNLLRYEASNDNWVEKDDIGLYLSNRNSSEGKPFVFNNLKHGTYILEAVPDSFSGLSQEYYDNALKLDQATRLTVTAGSVISDIEIIIGENPNRVSIAGKVTNQSGDPLSSIFVDLSGTTVDGTPHDDFTYSGSDGRYYFNTFPPGDYKLFFIDSSDDYVAQFYRDPTSSADPQILHLITGTIRNDINIQLQPSGQISGTVRFFDGTVPESVTVYAYRADQQNGSAIAYDYTSPDQDGLLHYRIEGLSPGEFHIKAEASYQGSDVLEYYGNTLQKDAALSVTVQSGKVTPNIDFMLGDAVARGGISGSVRNVAGKSIENVQVSAFVSGTTPYGYAYTKTNSTGDFHLPIFIPGDYIVRYEGYEQGYVSPQYYPNSLHSALGQPVRVTAGAIITNINTVLLASAEISGSITLYNGTAPDSASIYLYQFDGVSWMQKDVRTFYAEAQANRIDYRIRGLSPGQYRIGTYIALYPFKFYIDQPTLESATTITLDHGLAISNVNFSFGQDVANATIQGKVTTNGSIPTDVRVEVYKESEFGYYNLLVHLPPNDDGSFKIAGLEDGRYRVALRFGGTNEFDATRIYWNNSLDSGQAAVISLSETSTFSDVAFNFYRVHLPIISR